MSLPNDIQLQYGVKTFDELIHLKTDDGNKQTKGMPSAVKPHIVKISEDECKRLCEESGLEYQKGYEGRVIERIVTTEAVDRDGDIVRYHGIDNKNYRTNPVVLFAHDKTGLPVGNSIKEWKASSIKGWKSWDLYFDYDIDRTGWGDIVFRFVKSGAMPGGSLGFIPKDAKWDHTPKERKEIGLGTYGVEYIKVEKIEHSACSVPANQEALARHLKSLDREMLLKEFRKDDFDIVKNIEALDENLIDVFYSVLFNKSTVSLPSIKIPDKMFEDDDYEESEEVMKPYPTEYACRLNDPNQYESFRRSKRKHDGKEYSVIYGKKDDKWEEQAYRYKKDIWTEAEAKTHCKDHDGKYEAASDKDMSHTINLNLDISKIQDEICEISKLIKMFHEDVESIQKTISDNATRIMARLDKMSLHIESKNALYDRSEIEDALKIKINER